MVLLVFGRLHHPLTNRGKLSHGKSVERLFDPILHGTEKGKGLKCLKHKAWQQLSRTKMKIV